MEFGGWSELMKVGRNERCLCGSGRKYKQCCLAQDDAREREEKTLGEKRAETPIGLSDIFTQAIDRVRAHDKRFPW